MASLQPQIRVLDLLPAIPDGDGRARIQCKKRSIHITDAGTTHPYEAISYVWGTQTDTVPIIIDDAEFMVTKSLHAVLSRLQLRDSIRTLWVDQICIDQSDPKDKEAQVPLMATIYSSCSRCLIWLGEVPLEEKGISLDDAQAAFDIISYTASAINGDSDPPNCLCGDVSSSATKVSQAMAAMKAMSRSQNPWWNRIWTVQEVTLPKTALLLWGPLILSWETVQQATLVLTGQVKAPFLRPLIKHVLSVKQHRAVFNEVVVHSVWLRETSIRNDTPLFLFKRWRSRLATDPRDKVYGLLGLLKSRCSLPLSEVCHYEKSVAEVFTSLTVDIIAYERSLRHLISDPRLEPDLAAEGIPSWAFDMSSLARYDTDWFHVHSYNKYKANDGLAPLDLEELKSTAARTKGRTLQIRGVMVDVVQEVGQPMVIAQTGYMSKALRVDVVQDWYTLISKGVQDDTGDKRGEFASLLLGDWVRDAEQRPSRRVTVEDVSEISGFLETGTVSEELKRTVFGMTRNQRFFQTRNGLLGLGHLETKPGDEVWIFRGGQVPFTIEPHGEHEGDVSSSSGLRYSFVGRCHVQGIMYGEALRHPYNLAERSVQLE